MTRTPQGSSTTTREPVPGRTITTLLALVLPLAVLVAAAVVASSWRHELPDPIAVHWSSSGPDGFGSVAGFVGLLVLIGVAFCAGMWALGFWSGYTASTRRLANGMSVWFALFMAVVGLGTLQAQRGLADATEAGSVHGVLLAALSIATLAGGIAAWATPGDPPLPAATTVPRDAVRLDLPRGTRATWFHTASSVPGLVVGAAGAATTFAVTLVAQLWPLLAVTGLLVLVTLAMFRWQLRIDGSGLTARSALGWPQARIPLDEVVAARTTTVSPLRDFGGYGWRIGRGGATGIVLRRGEVLEVERSGGRVLVVTVDDAGTAAALLNALAARVRPTR